MNDPQHTFAVILTTGSKSGEEQHVYGPYESDDGLRKLMNRVIMSGDDVIDCTYVPLLSPAILIAGCEENERDQEAMRREVNGEP